MYKLLYTLHFTLCTFLFATVSRAQLPTGTVTRTATEAYVTNTTAQAVNAHATNATAHADLFAGKVGTSDATYTATVARAASAFGWGPHAGLYLALGWQPAWTNIIGLPSTFTPSAHNQSYTTIDNAPWITAPIATNITQGVIAPWTNRMTNAWQNHPDSTNWLWTSDGTQITLTNYTGPNAVFIPNMLNGLPVTAIGDSALSIRVIIPDDGEYWEGLPITSISGGENIQVIMDNACANCTNLTSVTLPQATSIGANAFNGCASLISISLPRATTIGVNAFANCTSLTYVSLPQATTLRMFAFGGCSGLITINLPQVTTIEYGALGYCPLLSSVYFFQNSPAEEEVYLRRTPIITNYVTNPTATWGATFGGMPVVRMPVIAPSMVFTAAGTNATYQMSWDVTNGTFRVLEILP